MAFTTTILIHHQNTIFIPGFTNFIKPIVLICCYLSKYVERMFVSFQTVRLRKIHSSDFDGNKLGYG
jgi:hypothetical protein